MAINDFNIGFLGKLDGTRSKNQINQDIEALKKSLNSLEIKATLDPQQKNALTKQLNLLQVSLKDASFSPKALNDLVSQVNNALKGIRIDIPNINTSNAGKSAIQAGKQIGNQIQNGINSVTKNANFEKSFSFTGDGGNALSEARKVFSGMNEGTIAVKENLDKMGNLNSFFVNIKKANGEIESLKYSLQKMKGETGKEFVYKGGVINDTGAIKQFQQMEKIVTDYQIKLDNLKTKYANANVDFSGFTDVFDKFKNGAASTNDLALAFSNLATNTQNSVNNLKSQSSSFDPIQQTLNDMRDLPSIIQNLETNMSGLSNKTSVAGINIKDLQSTYATLLAEMNANGGKVPMSDTWIKSYRTLTSTVAGATKQVETLKKSEAKAGKINLTQELTLLQRLTKVNTIEKWYKNNTAAAKLFGNELKEIIAEYKNFNKVMTKSDSNKLLSQVKSIEIASRDVNKLGFSFGDKLKNTWEKFGGLSLATGAMMRGFQEIKKGVGFIEELDDALTDVNYTTPMTSDNLVKLANDSVNMAKELKTSASNVLEAVKIYSTANTTSEEILNKSRASIMLSNVSGMSGEDSSQTIQTVLNQFELDSTNESLIGIVDTLEYVASQLNYDFSKSMEEISSGISESGNVAKQAGLSLEEYATILGTTIERSGIAGSQAGNAYKTIFSRITGASKTEGTMDEDISKAEASLRSIGVQVRDSENEFRDLTDIMTDLGSVWDSLSSTEKSNLGYNIAGIRQLNVLNSLMSGWKDYEKIIESVDNKVGTAEKNQKVYEESMQGKLNGLTSTGQSIWNNILNSDELEVGIDLLTSFLNIIDKLTKSLGGLGTISVGAGLFAGIKNFGIFKTWYNDLREVQSVISNISNVSVFANGATRLLNTASLTAMTTAVSGLSKEQALLALSTKNLTNAQKEQVLVAAGIIATEDKITASAISQALAKSKLSATEKESLLIKLGLIEANATCTKEALLKVLATKGIVGADADAIISSTGLTVANGAQTVSFDLLTASIGANIKALGKWLVTNPVGWAILGGTAIFGLVKAYDALTDSVDEVKNRTNDLMSSFSSAISKANENAKSVESIASRYEELSKGVNNLGENVSLTTDEYSEYNDIVNQIAEMFPTLISGYTDEGNAILTLKGNVEQVRDAYKEAQQEAYNMLITSGKTTDGNNIIKNWDNLHDTDFFAKVSDLGAADVGGKITTEDAIKQLKEFQNMTAETYREIERITSSGSRKEISGLTGIQKDIGYGSYLYKALGIDAQSTDQEIANAKKQAQVLVQTYNAEVKSALNDVESLANAYLMTNDDYSSLSEQSKTAASLIVNSLNEDIVNGFKSKEDVGAYVAEIVSMIKDNPDMNNALVGLFSLDTTNMSVDDIKTKVDGYIKTIANILHEDENEVKVRLGFDDSNTDTLVNNVKGKLQDSFDNKVGELSLEDLDIAANNLEIPDGVILSWDELITKIQEYKDNLQNTDETQIEKKIGELSSQLDNIQTAYSSLMSATDQYNETGYITIDQLQSLISNGSEFLDYLIDENGNLKTDTESMQELTKARLVAMEAQVQQGLIDNITNIQTESDANVFLASTNYELADSYKELASASIGAWKVQALNNGLDKSVVNEVLEKYNTDSKKISDLFSKANIGVEYNFDDAVGKSSSSSSSSSNSSSESETIIDFAEQRLNELNDLIDETKENIEQLEGSASKNSVIDSLIGIDNSKLSTLQQVHDLYEDMANQYLAKIPNEYKDLAKNGGIEIDKFVGDGDIADAINDYQSWADKVDDVNSEMLELKQTLKDLELDKFNNIKDDFEDMYNIIDKNKSKINDVVGLLEAQGQNIGDAFYKELISETETQISNLKDERIRLSSQMNYALNNGVENGSDEWKEMYDTLQDVDSSIISCEKDIADFQKSLNQLHWDNLEKLENQFSSINDEIGNLNNLLDEDTVSADGNFTSKAITQIGLLAQQYELARTEVEQYSEEIDYLNQLYKNGSISTNDYNDKLLELQNAQWDSISLSEEAKDAILDLAETRVNEVIDAINEETDAYKEMIDKQKESLQAEKDLYDYKKSIAEKESEITAIKRRVNAMMGSDDASTIAEREKLEAQLADLTSDLEDYKYEHSVELRQDALDKELEDFEKAQDSRVDILEDSLKDEESILQSSIKEAKLRANEIANVLLKLEQKQGIAINSYIINPWKSGVGAIAGYNQALNSSTSNFIAKLNGIKINIQNTQTQANNMARTIMSAFNISNNSGVYEAISKVRQNLYNTSVESIHLKQWINSALNSTYGNGAVNSINNVRDAANKAGSSVNGLRYEINQLSKSIPDLTTNMTAFATGAYAASSYKDLLDMIKRNEARLSAQSGQGNLPSAGINKYLPFPMFAEGGVVNGKSNKLAQGFGEDVTIFAKKGERILSLEQTKSFEEMVKNLPKVTPVLDNLVKNIKLPNFDFSNIGRNNISPIINVDAGITVQGNVDKNFAKEFENLQNNLTKNVTSKIANSLEKLGVQKNNCRPL